MSKLKTIIDSSWTDSTLFPESVPHLLHWDLAYLWILEKDTRLRPTAWRLRIAAWSYLVSMLLAGELHIEDESVASPLLDYTRPHGIDRVQWVLSTRTNRKIAVLSPTVLIRPLPDFKDEDLDSWNRQRLVGRLGPEKKAVSVALLGLVVDRLRRDGGEGTFQDRLANVLAKEFDLGDRTAPPAARIHRKFLILKDYSWSGETVGERLVEEVELPVHQGKGARVFLMNYCEHCSQALLQKRDAQPISPEGDTAIVVCAHCGDSTEVKLEDFLIWNWSEAGRVIVWKPDPSLETPAKGMPPRARIEGSIVEFEWDPPIVAGDKDFRFIVFNFRNQTVEEREIREIFFDKLLVPSSLRDFSGLPFRSDWLASVINFESLSPEISVPHQVLYRGIRLRGWPATVKKVFGNIGLYEDPHLSVGIFPDPNTVCWGWKCFRTFLDGKNASKYAMNVEGGRSILPALVECLDGCPRSLTIFASDDGRTGATFKIKRDEERVTGTEELHLGIDFGTTQSLVYFVSRGEAGRDTDHVRNGVKPAEIRANIGWLAGSERAFSGVLAGFLPVDGGIDRVDPYLIPSALWEFRGQRLIRWSREPPSDDCKAVTGFKRDQEGGRDNSPERLAFLRELVFLTLPYVLHKIGLTRHEQVEIKVGMAFPLAFDPTARSKMRILLEELQTCLAEQTGLSYEFFTVNESIACVEAFGQWKKGETYLIADLGGSTLDVALFTATGNRKSTVHQLGSLDFAGETFIKSFAAAKEASKSDQDAFEWKVRDAVTDGSCRKIYGSDETAARVLGRFRMMVLEFLRTMVASHQKQKPSVTVQLVLAGNGWHLSDAFDRKAGPGTWRNIFKSIHQGLVDRVGNPRLQLYLSEEIDKLPTMKHIVVKGTLANATGSRRRKQLDDYASEQYQQEIRPRLPAGRTLKFTKIGVPVGKSRRSKKLAWYSLVGEGAWIKGFSDAQLKNAVLDIDLDDIPPASDIWIAYLLSTFEIGSLEKIPYPTPQRLHAQTQIEGDPDAYIKRGPLQVILEGAWREFLTRIES